MPAHPSTRILASGLLLASLVPLLGVLDACSSGATSGPDGGAAADGATGLDGGGLPAGDVGGRADAGATDAASPVSTPAWLAGKPKNEWFQIPGTAGAGGSSVYAYSGMAFKNDTSEILIALAGGHGDSADNRVVSLRLDQDAPAWTTRLAASAQTERDVAYYPDGRPSARHTYYATHYVPQVSRLMVIGAQFVYGSAVSFNTVDGFDLATNTWDPKGTWPDTAGGFGIAQDPTTGDVWTGSNLSVFRWSASTHQQTKVIGYNNTYLPMQNAWDPVRGRLVCIGFGDGWGYGNYPTLNAFVVSPTGEATALTFNPSDALTQFTADHVASAALEYDPDHDRFLYFGGQSEQAGHGGRVYVITPTAGTTWDVGLLPLGPGSQNPPQGPGTGVWNRFRYVPALKGLVYLPAPGWNNAPDVYFLKLD
ncbi:MAG: hypothetical protein QM765_34555 [Myxococcales bacterium]